MDISGFRTSRFNCGMLTECFEGFPLQKLYITEKILGSEQWRQSLKVPLHSTSKLIKVQHVFGQFVLKDFRQAISLLLAPNYMLTIIKCAHRWPKYKMTYIRCADSKFLLLFYIFK